jgi:chromosome segregation ATPase
VALFNDIKASLNQFAVDSEAQKGLNAQIAELQQANLAIIANKNATEHEIKSLSNQLQATRNDSSKYKSQLDVKAQELKDLQALPKEDPRLIAKIEELEKVITSLRSELQSATQQVASKHEENAGLQETIRTACEKISSFETETLGLQANFVAEMKKAAELAEQDKIDKEKWHQNTLQNLRQQNTKNSEELESALEKLKVVQGKLDEAVAERKKAAKLSEQDKIDKEKWHQNTLQNLRQQNTKKSEELESALVRLKVVQGKLDEATRNPEPALADQIAELSASANQLFATSSSRTTTELITVKSLKLAVQNGSTETKQTQKGMRKIKEVQESLTRSLQEAEARTAALSKEVSELRGKVQHRRMDQPKAMDGLSKSHVAGSFGEDRRAMPTSSTNIHPETLSTPKAASDGHREVIGSITNSERVNNAQHTTSTRPKAQRVPALRAHPVDNRGSNHVTGRVIPDSQSHTETQFGNEQQVREVEAWAMTPSVTGQTTSNPQALESTPTLLPFASMDLRIEGSGTSDVTRFSDLFFDDLPLELIDSEQVIAKAEVLSHNKHEDGQPTKLIGDHRPFSERNATTSSNQGPRLNFIEHTTPSSAKIDPMARSAGKQPLHRQPSKSLKSAMKAVTGSSQSKGNTSAEPSNQATQMRSVHAKMFKSNEASTQGPFNLYSGTKRNPSAYRRVASGVPAAARNDAALANTVPMSSDSMNQSQISPIPNAARRNSSFTGFNVTKKRPAETQTTSSTSKAARLSNPTQLNTEIKGRLSIQTAGLGFGKRR